MRWLESGGVGSERICSDLHLQSKFLLKSGTYRTPEITFSSPAIVMNGILPIPLIGHVRLSPTVTFESGAAASMDLNQSFLFDMCLEAPLSTYQSSLSSLAA